MPDLDWLATNPHVRKFVSHGHCKGCSVAIVWVEHKNGKLVPYTLDGVNHFATCPVAAQFKKKKGKA